MNRDYMVIAASGLIAGGWVVQLAVMAHLGHQRDQADTVATKACVMLAIDPPLTPNLHAEFERVCGEYLHG